MVPVSTGTQNFLFGEELVLSGWTSLTVLLFSPPQRSLSPRSISPPPSPEVRPPPPPQSSVYILMFRPHMRDGRLPADMCLGKWIWKCTFIFLFGQSADIEWEGLIRYSAANHQGALMSALFVSLSVVLFCVPRGSPGNGWRFGLLEVLHLVPPSRPAEPTALRRHPHHTRQTRRTHTPLVPRCSTSTDPVLTWCSHCSAALQYGRRLGSYKKIFLKIDLKNQNLKSCAWFLHLCSESRLFQNPGLFLSELFLSEIWGSKSKIK